MNKKFSLFFIILTFGILYILNVDRVVKIQLISFNKYIQSSYVNSVVFVGEIIDKYFSQIEHIEQLKDSNNQYQLYKLLYDKNQNRLKEFVTNNSIDKLKNKKYIKVKALSYYQFNDFSRVILDIKSIKKDKIYALATLDGYSAGTVLMKDNKPIAFLNQNYRCNYTVFIGDESSPGITSGVTSHGDLIIKYVPIWKNVTIGDEVITSSMDNLFPYGLKVGKVVRVKINENTKEVYVSAYAKTIETREFYLYKNDINVTIN